MRTLITSLILSICLACTLFISSCSDNKRKTAPSAQKETAIEKPASSVITDKHVKIPNSQLYLIPPTGFTVDDLSGTVAQKNGTAHFMQMQILSGYTQKSFFETMKTEAEKNFPGSWKEEPITVNGHAATICRCKTAGYSQYFMAFTDGYTDEMIIANYEEKDMTTAIAMYEALKTVVVKK
jgi:hypothetical protein